MNELEIDSIFEPYFTTKRPGEEPLWGSLLFMVFLKAVAEKLLLKAL